MNTKHRPFMTCILHILSIESNLFQKFDLYLEKSKLWLDVMERLADKSNELLYQVRLYDANNQLQHLRYLKPAGNSWSLENSTPLSMSFEMTNLNSNTQYKICLQTIIRIGSRKDDNAQFRQWKNTNSVLNRDTTLDTFEDTSEELNIRIKSIDLVVHHNNDRQFDAMQAVVDNQHIVSMEQFEVSTLSDPHFGSFHNKVYRKSNSDNKRLSINGNVAGNTSQR